MYLRIMTYGVVKQCRNIDSGFQGEGLGFGTSLICRLSLPVMIIVIILLMETVKTTLISRFLPSPLSGNTGAIRCHRGTALFPKACNVRSGL
jgi:hypothetical protein